MASNLWPEVLFLVPEMIQVGRSGEEGVADHSLDGFAFAHSSTSLLSVPGVAEGATIVGMRCKCEGCRWSCRPAGHLLDNLRFRVLGIQYGSLGRRTWFGSGRALRFRPIGPSKTQHGGFYMWVYYNAA